MKYPKGKLNQGDKGELKMAVFVKCNRLIIDFGKEISWLGFAKEDVENLIELLQTKIKEL